VCVFFHSIWSLNFLETMPPEILHFFVNNAAEIPGLLLSAAIVDKTGRITSAACV
jgi:hypothetical protein